MIRQEQDRTRGGEYRSVMCLEAETEAEEEAEKPQHRPEKMHASGGAVYAKAARALGRTAPSEERVDRF